jgi:prepilin-type N-terminal cleavage/methylation domain-containing protein
MQRASRRLGFTLIELLTVIAIIAILAAIIFPLAGTVRESARSSDCMSKLHQIWVSANVYRSDEGAFPPTLLGFAEYQGVNLASGQCDARTPSGVYYGTDTTHPCSGRPPVNADRIISGFLYSEQIKDVNVFRCPDNPITGKGVIAVAHYSLAPPPNWPVGQTWIGQELANKGCPTDAYGTIDCFVDHPQKVAKSYYVMDSYDIGPLVDVDNNPITLNGQAVYIKHYSTDWTGVRGATDLPNQLKYSNPPDDKTLLAYCTWHSRTAKTSNVTSISNGGTAKKLNLKQVLDYGPNIYGK